MAKRGNSFFGDSGTMLPEQARDEIGKNDGESVDIAQQYAQSEADEYTEQAERITRSMERSDGFKHSGQFSDPEKRRQFVESLAENLRGRPAMPARPQEEKEEPFLSRKADDKFWASDEPKKQMPKRL
jgi:hypothetical protein